MKPPEFNTKRPSSCLQNRGHFKILTIEGLLNATQYPRYPDLSQGSYTFKRATLELNAAEEVNDLFREKGMEPYT